MKWLAEDSGEGRYSWATLILHVTNDSILQIPMKDRLIDEIRSIVNLSEEDITLFMDSFNDVYIKKGDHFLTEGQVCRNIAYVKQGLLMYYKIIDGNEVPCDFAMENGWVTYLKSFSTSSPSDLYIKALEDSHLLTLSSTRLKELFDAQPKFLALRSYYTELYFISNAHHAANLATLTAKERYYKFMKENPELISRVPQYLIAAYLGIRPQSLSRIRK